MNVVGESRAAIGALTKDWSRPELLDLIYKLATIQPMYTVQEVAAARSVTTATVQHWIRSRKLRAHLIGKQYRIPLDAVHELDRSTSLEIQAA